MTKHLLLFLISIIVHSTVLAQNNACYITGQLDASSGQIKAKDCIYYTGSSPEDFKFACEASLDVTKMFADTAEMTYMATCPDNYQAACIQPRGHPFDYYYYDLDEQSITSNKEDCLKWNGEWKE